MRKLHGPSVSINDEQTIFKMDETMTLHTLHCGLLYGKLQLKVLCVVDENNNMYLTKGSHSIGIMTSCIDKKQKQNKN